MRKEINMSSSYSSSIFAPKKYDVFLNFRAEDVGDNFVSHLYGALRRSKIRAYMDPENLERSEGVSLGVMKAIDESKVSVIIFSENYASSPKCLDELVHILECRERGKLVIPVFYRIDPSHLQKQKGPFESVFLMYEQEAFKNELDRVDKWRRALEEGSHLSGWTTFQIRYESKLVETILEDIVKKLKHISSNNDSELLVGIDERIMIIESLVHMGSPGVHVVGIWGQSGIGKTTLASAVYNRLSSQFEYCCFLANVMEESKRHGLINLRNKVLAGLLEEENQYCSGNSSLLASLSKEKLRRKKVLLVLDDVNNSNQFELLARKHDQFGPGSRILVTTRDLQMLKNIGASCVYRLQELNYNEALQLFHLTAFRKTSATTDQIELSKRIVNYTKGIPLALKVLGSHFQYKSNIEAWEDVLVKLKKFPYIGIINLLRVSYDALDNIEKDIFLDIACFFKGMERSFVEKMLEKHQSSCSRAINNLIDKCLLTLGPSNELWMHDLIQDMGREIAQQISHVEPEKRNRLWIDEDINRVSEDNMGTNAVEGISLDLSQIGELYLSPTIFEKMTSLRLLKIYSRYNTKELKANVAQDFHFLPSSLRYLHWERYPLKSLPSNFSVQNLVELNLSSSKIELLWNGVKHLGNLKKIVLSNSRHLIQLPDLSQAPKLESLILQHCTLLSDLPSHLQYLGELSTLILDGCSSLKTFPELPRNIANLHLSGTSIEEVPASIEYLPTLKTLQLSNCKRLKSLPTSISKLKSLQRLNMSGCSMFVEFPEILEPMESLQILCLNNTGIKELPSSIENLVGLEALDVEMCVNLTLVPSNIYKLNYLENLIASNCIELKALPVPQSACLHSLSRLKLSNCSILEIPEQLGLFPSLESLDLSGNIIDTVPTSIKKLSKLKHLDISNCRSLKALPEIPLFVEFVDAHGCTSLETVSSSKFSLTQGWDHHFPVSSEKLVFFNCLKLDQNARSNLIIDARLRILRMATLSLSKHVPGYSSVSICYPGNQIPKWFNYQSMGSSIHVKLSPHWRNSNFLGFALCIVAVPVLEYSSHSQIHFHCESIFRAKNGKTHIFKCFLRGYSQHDDEDRTKIFLKSDHLFLWYDHGLYLHELEDTFTEASFDFYPIDSWERKINSCTVEKCGIHLLYLQEGARLGFINQGLLGESKVEQIASSGESELSDNGINDSDDGIKELRVEDIIQNGSEQSRGRGRNVDSEEDDNQLPKETYRRKSNSCLCFPFLSLIKEFWEHVLGKKSGYEEVNLCDGRLWQFRMSISEATAVPLEEHLQAQEEFIRSMNSQIMQLSKQNKQIIQHLQIIN